MLFMPPCFPQQPPERPLAEGWLNSMASTKTSCGLFSSSKSPFLLHLGYIPFFVCIPPLPREKLLVLSIEYEEFQENSQEYEAELEGEMAKGELERQKLQLQLTRTQDQLSESTTANIKKEREVGSKVSTLIAQVETLQSTIQENKKKLVALESVSVTNSSLTAVHLSNLLSLPPKKIGKV